MMYYLLCYSYDCLLYNKKEAVRHVYKTAMKVSSPEETVSE